MVSVRWPVHGDHLLERNIRRYLGLHGNRVNRAIARTLRDAAEGSLKPALAAIAEPPDGAAQAALPSFTGGEPIYLTFSNCSDKLITPSRTFAVNAPFSFSTNPGSGFSGTLSGSGNIQASATGEIQVTLKRAKVLGWCIPYGVRLNFAHA
jgi:hypothetical protein